MPKSQKRHHDTALYEAISKLRDRDECIRFFEELCTPTEMRSLEQRFEVACCLLKDQVYTKILESTGASSATISRVKRTIVEDSSGAVCRAIEALEREKNRQEEMM